MTSQVRTLAQKFRDRFLDQDTATLRDAGVIDECGVHTNDGRNLMWSYLFSEDGFRTELAQYVRDEEAKEAAKDKKSKK